MGALEQLGERDRGVVLVSRPDDLDADREAVRRSPGRRDDGGQPASDAWAIQNGWSVYARRPSGVAIVRSSNGRSSSGNAGVKFDGQRNTSISSK